MRKLIFLGLVALGLGLSATAAADSVSQVWQCTLNEGKTVEDAHAANARWLTYVRKATGNDNITSSYVTAIVADAKEGQFMWVDTFPDLATWAAVQGATEADDFKEIGEALDELADCSGSRLWKSDPTEVED